MRLVRSLLALSAAVAMTFPAWAEDVPPAVKAKREGSAHLSAPAATPSPLNMIYTPVAPCRADRADILANKAAAFQITGVCGVPAYAKAVSVNLTAVPTGTGFLTAYPTGSTRPTIASLNYRASVSSTSGTITPISSAGKLDVYASAATKVYVDITGYYEPQLWAYVHSNGTLIDSSGRVTASARVSTGYYVVTFDRNINNCSAIANSDYISYGMGASTTGSAAYIYIKNGLGSSAPSIDYWFNLHVQC